jgi:hypothetical protein
MNGTLDVHHIDLDHFNDNPSNLVKLTHSRHLKSHGSLLGYFNWIFNIHPSHNFGTHIYRRVIFKHWISKGLVYFDRELKLYCVPVNYQGKRKMIYIDGAKRDQYEEYTPVHDRLPNGSRADNIFPDNHLMKYFREGLKELQQEKQEVLRTERK